MAFTRKHLVAAASRLAVNRNPMVWPVESSARYRYRSSPLILNVCLIDPVRFVRGAQMRPAAFVQFGRIRLHPAPDAARIDRKAPFGQHFGHVLICQRVTQIPSHRQKNDFA
jgi:hypothetical protein